MTISISSYLGVDPRPIDSPNSEIIKTKIVEGRSCLSYLPISHDGSIHPYFTAMAGHDLGGPTTILWVSNVCMQLGKFYTPGLTQKIDGQISAQSVVPDKSKVKFFDLKKPSFLITPHHVGHNFYHYMIDSLPRFAFKEMFSKFSKPILFSQSNEPFQKNTNELLLRKNYPIYETCNRVLMRECVITWPQRRTVAVDFLRKKSSRVAPNNNVKRLYVSRRNTLFRQVINEIDLEPILMKFDFTIIECEKISFSEQVSLFKSAEIVCGPHGAGLTNIAFCQKNTSILEISMEERLSVNVGPVFWDLACAADLDYHIVTGSRIPIDESNEFDGAMYVDPQKFEAALDYLIKHRK